MILDYNTKMYKYITQGIPLMVRKDIHRLVMLAAFFLLTGLGADEARQKVTLWTSWKQQAQFAGVYVAQEKGYYRELGLDVAINQRAPKSDIMTALKTGKVDIVLITLPEGIVLHGENPDVVSFGQICQHSSLGIVTRAKDNIDDVKKISNLTLAAWPGPIFILTELFLKYYNLTPKIIFTPNAEELMLWEVVSACNVMYYHEYYLLILNGILDKEMKIYYYKDYGLDIPEDGMFCLKSRFKDNPEIMTKFNHATMRGWLYAFEHEEESLEIVKKYALPFWPALQKWMLKQMRTPVLSDPKLNQPGVLNRTTYDTTAGLLLRFNMIKEIPKFEEFYLGPNTFKASEDSGNAER